MKTSMEEEVFAFLEKNCRRDAPILIALSGGADSTCLFHLLLAAREKRPFALHVSHVDHGWREESRKECEELRLLAEKENCLFHTCRLPPLQGNLEEESRKARLKFFGELQGKIQAQGVFMAHHQDDQAETVLKRLFEGASLTSLAAMRPVSTYGSLTLFRPLLSVPKKEILSFLEERNLPFFTDKTNFDTQFLRARMREELMPFLARTFGKELVHHLKGISDDAALLSEYMRARLKPVLEGAVAGPFGVFYEAKGLALFECRELFSLLSREHGITLSRSMRHHGATFLSEGAANKWLNESLYIDRGYLFIMKSAPNISWRQVSNTVSESKNSWKDVWRGQVATRLATSSYTIAAFDGTMKHRPSKKGLDRYLTEKKVPRAVAAFAPTLIMDGEVIEDFLTGTPSSGEQLVELCAFPIV